jgi:hypothetical protein
MAAYANVLLSDTFDVWRVRTNEVLNRLNEFAVTESSLYANTLTANVSFTLKAGGTLSLPGASVTSPMVSFLANTNSYIGTKISNNVTTTLQTQHIIPAANVTYNLGSADFRFNELFLAGSSIVLGNTKLTSTGPSGVFKTISLDANGNEVGTPQVSVTNTYLTSTYVANSTLTSTYVANSTYQSEISLKANAASPTFSGTVDLGGGTIDSAGANILNQTLSEAANTVWDSSLGQVAYLTLTGSRHINRPTNMKTGSYILRVTQGGSGSYNLTWSGAFKWPAGVTPTLTTAVGSVDLFSFVGDGTHLYGSYITDVK